MAVVATTTYLYVDTNLTQYFVQGSELVDRGPWSSSAFYNPNEVIQIGVDQYICLVANSNTPPTGIVDENWSTLVVVEEVTGSVINAGSDYYARYLAEYALQVAFIGTAIGSSAYNYAEAAYNLAIIGTNNPGGFSVGTDAYYLAESGTNIAWSAYAIAVDGTNAAANANAYASIAWDLAQMGTNTGTEALNQAASAQSTADSAFSIAVDGTNTAANANAYANIAWDLAQMGTNTGTAAYNLAQSGSNTAYDAYLIAVNGTSMVFIEQGTRAQEDQNLQNQISVLQSILGLSFQGTLNLFTAQVRYGKPDTNFTIIDGVLAGREESKFIWDDFNYYGTTTGSAVGGPFDAGSSWNGNGSIYTNNLVVGIAGTDWMNLYPAGTITSTTLNDGTGWAATGTWSGSAYWYATVGTDTFENYTLGTLSGGEMTQGGGWIGAAIVYAGSNRP